MLVSEGLIWFITFIAPAVTVIVWGIVKAALDWLKKTYGIDIPEPVIKATLQEAINFGIGYAIAKAKEVDTNVKFDNRFIDDVVKYVVERVPDALEHFGITPTSLEAMVKARIGLLQLEGTKV